MADPQVLEIVRIASSSFASAIFKTLIPIILVIGTIDILVVFIFRKKLSHWTGKIGEGFVSRKLNKFSATDYRSLDNADTGEQLISKKLYDPDSTQYKILNNLVLPSKGNTSVTQIDHVIVSSYGIFVVETKAYKGWIFGSANQEYWTQVIFRYKKRFYNPLRQNFAHTKAIENLLGSKHLKASIISLIAFPYADKLKISGTDFVGYTRDIKRKIESYTDIIYSDTERDEIVKLLVDANIIDKEVRKLHNREVEELKNVKLKKSNLKKLQKIKKLIGE